MKFGKEFAAQMVHEWQDAYMDYNDLKKILKGILLFKQQIKLSPLMAETSRGELKRKVSLYRAFSGLTTWHGASMRMADDDVILVSAVNEDGGEEGAGQYRTMFFKSADVGGESETFFFKRMDDEFNKVVNFYNKKVEEALKEADELSKQMEALIALRFKVERPVIEVGKISRLASSNDDGIGCNAAKNQFQGMKSMRMDVIQEVELSSTQGKSQPTERKGNIKGFRPAPLEVLDHAKLNIEPETPVATLKSLLPFLNGGSSCTKAELKKAEQLMAQAFIEFHRKLRLLKRYCFLNQFAFSKIMKKYDKVTSRSASKAYMEMVDSSELGNSDVVNKMIGKVETAFVKHFANGNHRKGMKSLRPTHKREKHRITFFTGFFFGCFIALVAAIVVVVHVGKILNNPLRYEYMENIFPLYSFYLFIVLHMFMFAGNIFFWNRYRVNYSFIFGLKQGTEMSYREVLLLSSGLGVLALAGVLSNLEMEMDPRTASHKGLTELVPLALLIFVLCIIFCPFNVIYRSTRFFLIRSAFHCMLTPFYKVILPDFFLADQLTSQVQAYRNLEFYVCYYGLGDYRQRLSSCQKSQVFETFYYIVAIVPYWIRFLQCMRRLFEEKDHTHCLNGLKYLSTIAAVALRTAFDSKGGSSLMIAATVASVVATIANTYWDLVKDWGLLRRDSRNRWLRDKLVIPNNSIYFIAMVLNVVLRLAWMQSVLGIRSLPYLHNKALVALVASLEIIRRGMWNFFRLENEHLNNVGKYRAFKSVPLPFNYDDEDRSV